MTVSLAMSTLAGNGSLCSGAPHPAISLLKLVSTSPGGPFTPVTGVQTVGARTTFDLDATGRYVVVWITRLPPGGVAHVNEVDAS